jgi:hypothetical protein
MTIGQGISFVFAFPRTRHDVFAAENPQSLRNRRDRFAFHGCQFTDTSVTLRKTRRQPETRRIAQRPEKAGGLIHRCLAYQQRRKCRMPIEAGFIVFCVWKCAVAHGCIIAHFIKCASVF